MSEDLDPVDKAVEELLETREADVMETPGHAPLRIPDEEDVEELLADMHSFLAELLERQQPKWVKQEGLRLFKELSEIISWNTYQ